MAGSEEAGTGRPSGGERWYGSLDTAFDTAIARWQEPGPPLSVLFSGGVDSALLAWELRHRGGITLFTVGRAGAADLASAETAAQTLGLPWQGAVIAPADLMRTVERIGPELLARPPGLRGLHIALAAAIERAPPGVLLCGQGIDELFLGYAHFRGLMVPEARARAETDLRRLQDDDWPATRRLAGRWGREIAAPFLHPEFVRAALAIPIELRLPGRAPKAFWREWTLHRGVPALIAERPKRAMQYGSGIDRWYRSFVSRR